jgi:hypothetical protein
MVKTTFHRSFLSIIPPVERKHTKTHVDLDGGLVSDRKNSDQKGISQAGT